MYRNSPLALATAILVGISTVASAAPRHELVIFGDSLADTGNVYAATSSSGGEPIPPSPPYFNGRFSNGPVWVEHLAEHMGITPPQPSLLGGTNYAFGGAETAAGIGAVGSPGLLDQVQMYLGAHQPDGDELFILWSGANDFLIAGADNPVHAVANIDTALRALADAGAREILVPNLPNLGSLPGTQPGVPPSEFIHTPQNAHARSAAFNAQLDAALDGLAADHDLVLHRLDAAALLDAILANPQQFGLREVDTPYLLAGPGADPDDHLFFDTVHVTAATHRLIAEQAAAVLAVPSPTAASAGLVLAVIAGWRRRTA